MNKIKKIMLFWVWVIMYGALIVILLGLLVLPIALIFKDYTLLGVLVTIVDLLAMPLLLIKGTDLLDKLSDWVNIDEW